VRVDPDRESPPGIYWARIVATLESKALEDVRAASVRERALVTGIS
jgi:hypothetical protein